MILSFTKKLVKLCKECNNIYDYDDKFIYLNDKDIHCCYLCYKKYIINNLKNHNETNNFINYLLNNNKIEDYINDYINNYKYE